MNIKVFLMVSLCVLLCGCGRSYSDEMTLEEIEGRGLSDNAAAEEHPSDARDTIYVYACGEVASPGVYEVKADSRIFEILALAGGVTAQADLSYINQAESCYDGEKIYIPSEGEYEERSDDGMAAYDKDGRIDINTADSQKLQELKGIGASRAEDIVAYRESNGRFKSIEAIMDVPGIKQGTFDKIKEHIKV